MTAVFDQGISGMDAATLKSMLLPWRDLVPQSTSTRLHRAISWLLRSEQMKNDDDVRFILLWVAFNAAYAQEFGYEQTERTQVRLFFDQLLRVDRQRRIHQLLFQRYSGPIRNLIDNRYLFEPFWRAMREHDSSERWSTAFVDAKRAALIAVMSDDTAKLLGIVMDRLYVLRNQLVHGGATHSSRVNRQQVHDAVTLLEELVPLVIELMLDAQPYDFGAIEYPVIPD